MNARNNKPQTCQNRDPRCKCHHRHSQHHPPQKEAKAPSRGTLEWIGSDENQVCDVIIEKDTYSHRWFMLLGHHHIIIHDDKGREIADHIDPMTVALAIKAKANGPINVIANIK